jgi:serine/threonine protein kinase
METRLADVASGCKEDALAHAAATRSCPDRPARALPGMKPGQHVHDFELLRLLGEGSFGQVFLARQVSLNRSVALKVTANQGSEARTLASLEHDHIVQVYGEIVDQEHDFRLLYMQYVPGTTLDHIIHALGHGSGRQRHGRAILETIDALTNPPAPLHPAGLRDRAMVGEADLVQAACWLGARLAEALDYAHSRGVLHRDIKPANILVSPYGRPLLADFNLAFRTDALAAGAEQAFGGTLAYMAPEHLDAFNAQEAEAVRAVDERSDIYALGMVLYELVTGELAFGCDVPRTSTREALRQMAARRRSGAPPASRKNQDVHQALDHILDRCLDPDARGRYQTARQLARALDGCRELRRIEREMPTPGPLTRAAGRHPFAMLLILTIVPHLLGSLVNISYNALQIVGDLTPAQQGTFAYLVLGYNVLVYPVCLVVFYHLLAPVWQTWRQLSRPGAINSEQMENMRRRALSWTKWVVWLSCVGWLPGGLLFPLLIHFLTGPVSTQVFGHFLVSFTLSGLIALTYSFFGVTYLVVRVFYPRLWVSAQDVQETIRSELGSVARRLRLFQLLAGTIPLAGAVLMVAVGPETSGYRTFRLLVTALIVLGMTGFGLAVMVSNSLFEILAILTRTRGRPSNWSAYLKG